MAVALACNIFLFFAPWQNWGKASRRTAFCQGRVGQSISKIYIRTCCGLAELGGCMFHEGKMRDKEEAKKLTEKAHFARLTDLKCFRSCRLTHYTWTWWTDHLTIQHLPLDISLKYLSVETSHVSHHQAHELVESLWRSGVETVILGTGLPGGLWFVGCVLLLSLFEKSTFNFSKKNGRSTLFHTLWLRLIRRFPSSYFHTLDDHFVKEANFHGSAKLYTGNVNKNLPQLQGAKMSRTRHRTSEKSLEVKTDRDQSHRSQHLRDVEVEECFPPGTKKCDQIWWNIRFAYFYRLYFLLSGLFMPSEYVSQWTLIEVWNQKASKSLLSHFFNIFSRDAAMRPQTGCFGTFWFLDRAEF